MREPDDLNIADLRDRAIAAARGDAAFDLLIAGAVVADMATGELRAADVGICGAMIASVHAPKSRNDAVQIIDAERKVLTPGLIDMHMHIESSMITPEEYVACILPRGVTTLVWDPHEFGNVAGIAGVDYALKCAAASPMRILPLAPSCVPSAPGYEMAGADFGPDIIEDLLNRNGIAGLAEVMDMAAVVRRSDRMRGIVQLALASSKMVGGHARGLNGPSLQAYAAAGIGSDHELTSAADLLEKLRAGLTIELRGSHDHLLPEFAIALQALPQMPSTVTFCTDDIFPDDLLKDGALDHVVRRMVQLGLDPMRALLAVTLNAAIRLGRRDLGLVAPGKRADLVLFNDLSGLEATTVIRNGVPVGQDFPTPRIPQAFLQTCALRPVKPNDFKVPAQGPVARIATIDQPRFTQWGEARVQVQSGYIVPPDDTTLIAVIHRHGKAPVKPRVGFLRGWGKWRGAFATTISHDSHNLTVFGSDPADMAIAANALIERGGGMAVVKQGKVIAVLPLPIAGLVSDLPLAEAAARFQAVRAAMAQVVDWAPPYLVFKSLVGATLACNAGPHQTDMGIADPLAGRLLASPILADGLT